MNQTYTATIRNLVENTDREVTVLSPTPMEAHKSIYRETSMKEEISTIAETDGDVVYDTEKGFRRG